MTKKHHKLTSLLLALGVSSAAQAIELKRVTDSHREASSKNLVRHHMGATVVGQGQSYMLSKAGSDKNGEVSALLSSDPTIGYTFEKGRNSFIIKTADVELLDRVSFYHTGGAGKVSFASSITNASLKGGEWNELGYQILGDKGAVNLAFPGADVKYLKVTFDLLRSCRVYGFGAFGSENNKGFELVSVSERETMTVAAVEPKQEEPTETLQSLADFNLLTPFNGSKLIYASGSNLEMVKLLTDEDVAEPFANFGGRALFVYDLGKHQDIGLHRVSVLADGVSQVKLYPLSELQTEKDWLGQGKIDASFFTENTSVYESDDAGTPGRFVFDLGGKQAKYVAFEIIGDDEKAGAIYEFAAFSKMIESGYLVGRGEWADASKLAVYEGPLAGYSGANYLRRGSGGLGGRGPSGAFRRAVEEELARRLESVLDDLSSQDRSGEEETTTAALDGGLQDIFITVPEIQVVSRVAVSTFTVPGVGHLYYNAGDNPAAPGYSFQTPNGVIQPEILGREPSVEPTTTGDIRVNVIAGGDPIRITTSDPRAAAIIQAGP